MAPQALQYGVPRARERLPVAVELEGPVRPQLEGVELEGELHGVDRRVELPRVLRLRDGAPERGEPLLHDFRDAVAHGARAAVKLRGGGGEKAASAEHPAAHVHEPDVAQLPQAREPPPCAEGRADDLAYEDFARGLDGGELQVLLGAEVGEEPALTHPHLGRQPADGQTFQALRRSYVDRRLQDALARALPVRPARPGRG